MDLNIENKKKQIHFEGVLVDRGGEDDNEDIAYGNVQLVWCYVINYFVLFAFTMLAVLMAETEYDPQTNLQLNGTYRVLHENIGYCVEMRPPNPADDWLSFLRMIDTYVVSNVMFRLACGLSMCYRVFMPWALWSKLVYSYPRSILFKVSAGLMLLLQTLEVCCLMIFSINMLKYDYKHLYHLCFLTWLASNPIIMILSIWLHTCDAFEDFIDRFSIFIKLAAAMVFIWYAPQFYFTQYDYIWQPKCHPYVGYNQAIPEYLSFLSYFVFNLCFLFDIRDIRGYVYPRSVSGECEKVVPKNYKEGERYHRCR